jgi:riboflavin synthase
MFTGIIESIGTVVEIMQNGSGLTFWIESPISSELAVDQSLAHDGVCLTIEETSAGRHRVTAVMETLEKTRLREWTTGSSINLERAMVLGGRLDGHLVQGHVDGKGTCLSRQDLDGSWIFRFSFPPTASSLVIEKGSITVNGISLTAFDVSADSLSVAIIPYTMEHTNLMKMQPGNSVNLEFDLIGKYIAKSGLSQR